MSLQDHNGFAFSKSLFSLIKNCVLNTVRNTCIVNSAKVNMVYIMSWKPNLSALDDIVRLIEDTKVFYAERVYESDSITRSAQVFMLGSVGAIMLLWGLGRKISVPIPPVTQLLTTSLMYVLLLAGSLVLAWRFVGVKQSYRSAASALLYCFGVLTPIGAILMCLLVARVMNPSLALSLFGLTALVLMICWVLRVWSAFSSLKTHNSYQSFGAIMVFGVCMWISSELISTVSTVIG